MMATITTLDLIGASLLGVGVGIMLVLFFGQKERHR